MIHVCYGLHDKDGRYSKFTGTSMLSILENTGANVTIHILHDNTMTLANWQNFIYIAGKYGQRVEFHNVEKLCADKIQFLHDKLGGMNNRFSIGTFFRLMVDKNILGGISKFIYLDSDTIVNLDIRELWNCSIENHAIASVPEIQATRGYMITDKHLLHSNIVDLDDYFCAGVIMVNLDNLDDNFFETGVQWLAENSQCECFDQDILNNFFSKTYLKLPEKFDAFVGVCRYLDNNALLPKIYHYAGNCLGLNFNDAYNKLFFTHFIKTPWFGLDAIQHLFDATRQIYIERQNFAIKLTKFLAEKKRAFLVGPDNVDAVKTIFEVDDAEEFIVSNEPDAFQRLVDSLNDSRGSKVFFILIDNYADARAALTSLGFSAGVDFVDVTAFLHDEYGVPLPAFTLVKLL